MAELEQPARGMVEANPFRPAWRAALASLLYDTGRPEEAQEQLDLLAARDFEDIPEDGDWLIAITLLAQCCADLEDQARAAKLYELLLPYHEVNVVIGLAAVCLGSAARYLGRLAAVIGANDEAIGHFERALVANASLKAPIQLAHTQIDYARVVGPGPRSRELIQAAERISMSLSLPKVARRLAQLQDF